jgi:hypothetical protein
MTDKRMFYNERLHEMLRWKRPHDSDTERAWTAKFIIAPYSAEAIFGGIKGDEVLAWTITVPDANGVVPKTMFSSHVDTMHRTEGRQKLVYNMATQCYSKNDGEALGADDTAGVWLMLEMIDRAVPGVYVFHRGEERGGVGSSGIASEHPDFLERFNQAVAFDRKGTYSVITWQGFGRCASDTYADALAVELNNANPDFMYDADDTGIFTDTANYIDYIPECTNLSVGYYDEHTGRERLYLPHLFALRDAVCMVDWESLPIRRDPAVPETWATTFEPGWALGSKFEGKWDRKKEAKLSVSDFKIAHMSRKEMEDLCYDDTELFIDVVRYELLGEVPEWAADEDDYYSIKYAS